MKPSAIERPAPASIAMWHGLLAACRIGLLLAIFAASQPSSATEVSGTAPHRVLARYPTGTYLENLTVSRRGEVLFTSYFARRVELWKPDGVRTFAQLPVHPVNLVETQHGFLVLAHAAAFTGGPAALRGSNRLLTLDRRGRTTRSVDLPELVFGNGMVLMSPASLLVTDSALGRIWRVDVASGRAEPWFEDARLLPLEGEKYPGANGLRRSGTTLYVSNSATRKLYTLAFDPAGRAASALTEMRGHFDGVDDFAVARDGALYIATHREAVVRWRPDGSVQTLLDTDVAGCTSTALSADGRTLYVLGTGGLFEGQRDPATLVSVELPSP